MLFSYNRASPLTEPGMHYKDFPTINCDSQDDALIVIMNLDNSTNSATVNNNCLTIAAKNEYDMFKFRDALVYQYYGIME